MRLRYYLAVAAVIVPLFVWLCVAIAAILRGSISWCPLCGTRRIRRSMRRSYDRLFPLFIVPFRCESCQGRFYALASMSYRRRPRVRPAPQPVHHPELVTRNAS